jgi:hypothetical protein
MKNYIKNIGAFFLIILFITAVLVKGLFQNIASKSLSFEKMFSEENIVETLITIFIVSIMVVALKLLWDWGKGGKKL